MADAIRAIIPAEQRTLAVYNSNGKPSAVTVIYVTGGRNPRAHA